MANIFSKSKKSIFSLALAVTTAFASLSGVNAERLTGNNLKRFWSNNGFNKTAVKGAGFVNSFKIGMYVGRGEQVPEELYEARTGKISEFFRSVSKSRHDWRSRINPFIQHIPLATLCIAGFKEAKLLSNTKETFILNDIDRNEIFGYIDVEFYEVDGLKVGADTNWEGVSGRLARNIVTANGGNITNTIRLVLVNNNYDFADFRDHVGTIFQNGNGQANGHQNLVVFCNVGSDNDEFTEEQKQIITDACGEGNRFCFLEDILDIR